MLECHEQGVPLELRGPRIVRYTRYEQGELMNQVVDGHPLILLGDQLSHGLIHRCQRARVASPIVGVNGAGDACRRIISKPIPTHPHAHGGFGLWTIQVKPGPALGWVIIRSNGHEPRYHAYAYCRDAGGRRPWLREFGTLNSAVAWMLQHEHEIRELISGCDPEPIDDVGVAT